MIKNKILVTGAAGYIGGTFTYEVLKKGFEVHGIDNFINSDRRNIDAFLRDFPAVFGFSEIDLAKEVKDEAKDLAKEVQKDAEEGLKKTIKKVKNQAKKAIPEEAKETIDLVEIYVE